MQSVNKINNLFVITKWIKHGTRSKNTVRWIVKRDIDSVKPPRNLKLTGNVDSSWPTFKQHFKLHRGIGTGIKARCKKGSGTANNSGPTCHWSVKIDENIDDNEKTGIALPRRMKRTRDSVCSRIQQQCEPFDIFRTDLKLKAKSCNFATLSNSMILDQVVFGVEDKKVREWLLREAELEGAIKIKGEDAHRRGLQSWRTTRCWGSQHKPRHCPGKESLC